MIFVIIVSVCYLILIFILIIGWERIPAYTFSFAPQTFISIVVPVRNEEDNILSLINSISKQKYSQDKFELIIVDDFSIDKTLEVITTVKPAFQLQVISLSEINKNLPNKKTAILEGIRISKGDIIVTTDGDCTMNENWLSTIEAYFRELKCKLASGPVTIKSNGSLWETLQQIEFASLIGSGAASLELGFPNMCNGANLAYRKDVFYEVNGFEGNEQIASGDDEFLMHKIYKAYPNGVKFIKSKEAVVSTIAQRGIKTFMNQRIRWASKWPHYKDSKVKILAVFIFIFNLSLLGNFILASAGIFPFSLFFEQLILKIFAEFVFLRRVLLLSGSKVKVFPFLVLEIIYPVYAVIAASLGLFGKYEWKQRIVKTN